MDYKLHEKLMEFSLEELYYTLDEAYTHYEEVCDRLSKIARNLFEQLIENAPQFQNEQQVIIGDIDLRRVLSV